MHKIDTFGNLNGEFTDGNDYGLPPTIVDAAWLNMVQGELRSILDYAGIAPVKNDNDQVLQAIIALIAGVVGTGGGSVPTTRAVTGGGLVSGGGALAADLNLSVIAATIAEVTAQLRNDVAVTPASLAGLASITRVGASAIIRFGPAMLQVTYATPNADSTLNVSWPTAFPNECLGAWLNGGFASVAAKDNTFVSGYGQTVATIYNAENVAVSCQLFGIGL